ncbi:MAG: phosphoribosyltransferase family protein [Bacteroidia bacterium]
MSLTEPTLILDAEQISQKINRLAYQIYENNFDEEQLLICGIAERGYQLAQKVYEKLKEISPFALELSKVVIDKENLHADTISLQPKIQNLENKAVILCDDVLYTGKTLAYAAVPFLTSNAKKLQCLVLIHRNHLHFPIQPTYIGMELATTLQEHVSVKLEGEESVFLS